MSYKVKYYYRSLYHELMVKNNCVLTLKIELDERASVKKFDARFSIENIKYDLASTERYCLRDAATTSQVNVQFILSEEFR